jgi:hypothetical protein
MIDPQQGLQALFEAMAHEAASEAVAPPPGSLAEGSTPLPDTIGSGSANGPSSFLDAALADHALAQQGSPSAGASAAALPQGGDLVLPAALLASATGEGDATSAALARLLSAASGETQLPASGAAAVAKVLAEAGASGSLVDDRTASALAALLVRGDAASTGASAALVKLLGLVRAALAAPAGTSGAAARADLQRYVTAPTGDAENAAASARTTIAPGSTGVGLPNAAVLPGEAAKAERPAERAADRVARATELAARDAVLAIPERDARGAPYDAAARARLAHLGRDPRRGFAPEATAALEAEREFGLEFERAPEAAADYTDADGVPWCVLTPREAFGLEGLLRALASDANVILTLKRLAPDQVAPTLAVAARLSNEAGLRRILIVEGERA